MESVVKVACRGAHPEGGGQGSDLLQGLWQIGLSPREMECVRLRTEGLRYEEIASVLGLQAGTLGALLPSAHEKVRKAPREGGHRDRCAAPAAAGGKHYAA